MRPQLSRWDSLVKRSLCAFAAAAAIGVASQASAATIYAIDDQDNLFTFDSAAPQHIQTGVFVSGLKTNEHLLNIDFRPADGLLYGIGSTFQLYSINLVTGAASPLGTGFGAVSGNSYGMDFNPAVDKIRFYSDADKNLRVNPDGSLLANDSNLVYKAGDPNVNKNPSVVGAGYTNSTNPAPAATTLYGIDSNLDTLVRVGGVNAGAPEGSPNAGLLTTVGPLGVDTNNFVGFDIAQNNVAVAALQLTNSSASHLYAIDLNTGAAADQGQILGGLRVVDIAVQSGVDLIIPEPSSLMLCGAGALMFARRRRTA